MNNLSNILLSILHSAGCSQKDFKKIFLFPEISIEKVYNDILNFSPTYRNIFGIRYEKIVEKLSQINITSHKNYLEENNINIVSFFEENYPDCIKHTYNYPFLIYFKGNIKTKSYSLAVVWSRKNTPYGNASLEKIFNEIKNPDISIISGGAYGIDSLAHNLAIKNNFHTIAVFGCGIDVNYPASNRWLFEKILENNGWLVSIFPIRTQPDAFNFPIRNEIVAWFANWVLIPEAWIKSWTLITARLALELGKDIFAIPGDIFRETSQWCNMLIASWEAKCTLSAEDIFIENNLWEQISIFDNKSDNQNTEKSENKKIFENEKSQKIYDSINNGSNTIDSIIIDTNLEIHEVMIELSMLEINWHIQADQTWKYIIIS